MTPAIGEVAAQDSYDPFAAEQFVNPAVQSAIGSLATLPQRAIEASAQDVQHLGEPGYQRQSIGPAVETAMTMMGGGAGGVEGGSAALGSGPLRRGALPMDEASRLRRAAEQGYTIDAYKGGQPYDWNTMPVKDWKGNIIEGADRTPRELTEINSPNAPYAGFFSHDPAVADRFAEPFEQGAVWPSKLKFDNPLVIDAQGKHAAAFQFRTIARREGMLPEHDAFHAAFAEGSPYDGVILRNTKDEGHVFVPRYPQQIRSRFADFDPANQDSGFLLGAGATDRRAAAATAASSSVARKTEPPGALFDYSRLGDVPNVPQFDLPRNIPPRGVPQRTLDITSDPGVRDKMLDVIAQGQKMGGANWYNAEPLRQAFNTELGKGGDAAFRQYMDMVAATSPRSDVGINVRNASYYYGRAMRGEPMPAVGTPNPQPYGHMAQRLHQMNAERVSGAGWDPLNNPKPASFVENLVGNQQPATIDTHAFRLPAILGQDPRFLETAFQVTKDAPKQNIQAMVTGGELPMNDAASRAAYWQAQPKANEYAAMENYYRSLGRDLGLTPAQTQASAWVGGGKLTGLASDESKPFLRFFEDRLNLTAEKRGETVKQTLKKFIRGQAPLLTAPPVLGGLAAQDSYQQGD